MEVPRSEDINEELLPTIAASQLTIDGKNYYHTES